MNAPPGTRESTYAAPGYRQAAPFSAFVLKAIENSNPNGQTRHPRPYEGSIYVGIPQYQAIGAHIGQLVAELLTGGIGVDEFTQAAQSFTARAMRAAGYH